MPGRVDRPKIGEAPERLQGLEAAGLRENIGAGVTAKRHLVVLKDLKVGCLLCKSAVKRAVLQEEDPPGPKQPRAMSTAELFVAAGSDRGVRLKEVLTELEKRPGEKVLPTLVVAVSNYDADLQKHGRLLVVRYLVRQNSSVIKKSLEDERAVVRLAAALVAGSKGYKLPDQLIPLLNDGDQECSPAPGNLIQRVGARILGRRATLRPARSAPPCSSGGSGGSKRKSKGYFLLTIYRFANSGSREPINEELHEARA